VGPAAPGAPHGHHLAPPAHPWRLAGTPLPRRLRGRLHHLARHHQVCTLVPKMQSLVSTSLHFNHSCTRCTHPPRTIRRLLSLSLCHCVTVSLPDCLHCATASLSHCLTVSLSHCVTVSLCHCVLLGLNRDVVGGGHPRARGRLPVPRRPAQAWAPGQVRGMCHPPQTAETGTFTLYLDKTPAPAPAPVTAAATGPRHNPSPSCGCRVCGGPRVAGRPSRGSGCWGSGRAGNRSRRGCRGSASDRGRGRRRSRGRGRGRAGTGVGAGPGAEPGAGCEGAPASS